MDRYSLNIKNKYTFKALKGRFWVTFAGEQLDYIVESGQELKIEKRKGLMIISELEQDCGQFSFEMDLEKRDTPQSVRSWRALF